MRIPRVVAFVFAVAWLASVTITVAALAAMPAASPRLDPATATEVERIVEVTRAAGLPTASLRSKALEGAAKGAPGERILAVVRAHAAALAGARGAIGKPSTDSEIEAGAAALMAGVPADSLARVRAARPGRSIVVPLVVLADLVARQVPTPTAVTAVLMASRAGAKDADLMRMRSSVERDIASGIAPASAAQLRARSLVVRAGTGPAPTPGERRP